MEVKNHINNTLATAKWWPWPLNRGDRWIEVSNTTVYWPINRDFGKWPLNGGWPLNGWPLNRGRTVIPRSYYMACQIRAFWLVLPWSGFRHTDLFRGNGHILCIFLFSKTGKFKTSTSLHTAGARKIWIDQSGFSRREKFWCPDVKLTSQERHWGQAIFLTGVGIKYPRNGTYNFKNQTSWQKVKNMNHFVFLSFYQLAPEMGRRRSAWQLARSSSSIARQDNSCVILNKICCSSSN